MVDVSISNEVNVRDKTFGISFRWKEQISVDVILSVWGKVAQCHTRFNALDTLVIEVHTVQMPLGPEV
jgi:hypothetical protein